MTGALITSDRNHSIKLITNYVVDSFCTLLTILAKNKIIKRKIKNEGIIMLHFLIFNYSYNVNTSGTL